MSKNLLLVYLFIFFITKVQAFSITGIIETAANHSPISGAYVFINNTQKFRITDSTGSFTLDSVDVDYCDLIIAAKGFQYISYRFTKGLVNKRIRFQLKDTVPGSSSLMPDSSLKEKYNEWTKLMYDRLFGTSSDKNYNYILNPEVLRFSYDSINDIIKIKATDKLYFLNELLGYMMNIFIDEITITKDNQYFSGYIYYTPLKYSNQYALNQCLKRRKDNYNGSLIHFMRTLYRDKLAEEGFEIKPVLRVFEGSKEFNKYAQQSKIETYTDSLHQVKKYIYMIDTRNNAVTTKDFLIKDNEEQAVFIKQNTASILNVTHNNGLISETSLIFFNPSKQIRIEPNGMFFEIGDIALDGWWNSCKLENLLPFDYNEE